MTAAELIQELQRMPPQVEVRFVMPFIWISTESGDHRIDLDESDACAAYEVRHMGPYVLISGA